MAQELERFFRTDATDATDAAVRAVVVTGGKVTLAIHQLTKSEIPRIF